MAFMRMGAYAVERNGDAVVMFEGKIIKTYELRDMRLAQSYARGWSQVGNGSIYNAAKSSKQNNHGDRNNSDLDDGARKPRKPRSRRASS